MTRPWIRLPAEPLIAFANRTGRAPSITELARVLARPDRSLWRWKAEGGIPLPSALEICDDLGIHPSEVWGDLYVLLPDDGRDVIGWHIARLRIALAERAFAAATRRHRPHATSAPRSIP